MTHVVHAVLQLEQFVPLKYLPDTQDKHYDDPDPEQVKQLLLHPLQEPFDKKLPGLHEEQSLLFLSVQVRHELSHELQSP